LTTTYAYSDDGPMTNLIRKPTRWRPRRADCTEHEDRSDAPGKKHVVKYRQGPVGTCALISEVLCYNLLKAGGLRTLDARYVDASPGFAASCRAKSDIPYKVVEGLHFGTLLKLNVENGPPTKLSQIEDPQEIVDIWVFDCWVCNIDRELDGNTLMVYEGGKGFYVIAADQSDCFGGSESLSNGRWKAVMKANRAASSVSVLDQAICHLGPDSVRTAIEKVRSSNSQSAQAMKSIPRSWWQVANLSQDDLRNALNDRISRLENIVDLQRWSSLKYILNDGRDLFGRDRPMGESK
jgi:hypothetical protein